MKEKEIIELYQKGLKEPKSPKEFTIIINNLIGNLKGVPFVSGIKENPEIHQESFLYIRKSFQINYLI